MKKLLLTSLTIVGCYGVIAKAQVVNAPPPTAEIQNYYTNTAQKENVNYFQDLILKGCTNPLKQLPFIDQEEISFDVDFVKSTLHQKFSKSFTENPQIKTMMDKALDTIATDPTCAQEGNDCRTRLVATATYFMQPLRPNVPGCDDYNPNKGTVRKCDAELSLRSKSLNNISRSNGGLDQRGNYKDILIQEQNNILALIQFKVLGQTEGKEYKKKKLVDLNKSLNNMAICGPVKSGVIYSYPLKVGFNNDLFAGLQTNKPVVEKKTTPPPVVEKKTEPCVEESKVLYSEFVPMNFKEGDSTVKNSEVKPVTLKIEDFIASHSNMIITNIDVTSSASKTPYYRTANRVYEKEYSDAKNLSLAKSRADFAQVALNSIKSQHTELTEAKYTTVSEINGPDFDKNDLDNRDINSSNNSNYKALVEKLYSENKDMLANEAMISSAKELLDTKRFTNLYDVKYKPYQGFKIVIKGYSKETKNCGDKATEPVKSGTAAPNKSNPVNMQN